MHARGNSVRCRFFLLIARKLTGECKLGLPAQKEADSSMSFLIVFVKRAGLKFYTPPN